MFLIRLSARDELPAIMCTCSSRPETNGQIASPASGAGAPYGVHLAARLAEMLSTWAADCVRLESTAQTLPSCGARLVVSLSRYIPCAGSQRRSLAAVLMAAAEACHLWTSVVSLRALQSSTALSNA